jgi:hypothetical protein
MKKKIFTLLVSSFLLSGAFSAVNAQSQYHSKQVNSNRSDMGVGISIPHGYVFPNCAWLSVTFTLEKNFTTNASSIGNNRDKIEILLDGQSAAVIDMIRPADPATALCLISKEGSQTINIPLSSPIGKKSLSFVYHRNQGSGEHTAIGPFSIDFIDYPTVTTDLDKQAIYDYYYDRTTQFPGKIEITRTGGSPDLQYSIDGFHWTDFPGTTASLTDLEMQNLIPGSQILVRERYIACGLYSNSFIDVPEHQGVLGGVISRPVYIGPVENATVIPSTSGSGMMHYVPSGKNFVFKIQPTGPNAGLKPTVTTEETRYLPEGVEGITLSENEPGVWTVTILGVQQSLNVNISFGVETESATGTAAVEGSNVWGADAAVYISSATAGSAGVYSTAGALLKTVAYPAGTTAVSLPAGFYFVSLNGGDNYKVAVK